MVVRDNGTRRIRAPAGVNLVFYAKYRNYKAGGEVVGENYGTRRIDCVESSISRTSGFELAFHAAAGDIDAIINVLKDLYKTKKSNYSSGLCRWPKSSAVG